MGVEARLQLRNSASFPSCSNGKCGMKGCFYGIMETAGTQKSDEGNSYKKLGSIT